MKDQVGADRAAQISVVVERPGVAFEVAGLVELNGVDEDRDDDVVALDAGRANQSGVPRVQRRRLRVLIAPLLFPAGGIHVAEQWRGRRYQ